MPGARVEADLWLNEYVSPWDVYQHGVTRVIAHQQTPFQQMYIVESGAFGKALVLDGKWQSSTLDEFLYHEPLVHPALVQRPSATSALVLGGGEGAALREVLRWRSITAATMVDIDGDVVEACREHLPEMHGGAFDDPRTELVIGEAIELLETTDRRWDVVIYDLSDPIEEGPSFKLFTKEFFEKAKRVMAPNGIFVLQAGPVSPAEIRLHATLVRTLRQVFSNVEHFASHTPSYASPWGFAIASDGGLDTWPDVGEVDALLAERVSGELKLLDGRTLVGMLQTPKYMRDAVAADSSVYTLDKPPRFFGAASSND